MAGTMREVQGGRGGTGAAGRGTGTQPLRCQGLTSGGKRRGHFQAQSQETLNFVAKSSGLGLPHPKPSYQRKTEVFFLSQPIWISDKKDCLKGAQNILVW